MLFNLSITSSLEYFLAFLEHCLHPYFVFEANKTAGVVSIMFPQSLQMSFILSL